MHCSKCGATIENGYKFCKSCGVAIADNNTPGHTNVISESASGKSKKQESTSNGNVVGFLTISGLFIAIIGTLVNKFHMSINPVFGVFFVIFFLLWQLYHGLTSLRNKQKSLLNRNGIIKEEMDYEI